jgi:hypothetical protein
MHRAKLSLAIVTTARLRYIQAVGLGGVASSIGAETDQAVGMLRWGRNILNEFYRG